MTNESKVPPEEILDMHIYHAGGYRVNGVEDKQGGVDFFKKGWPQIYNACIAGMKEFASRSIIEHEQGFEDDQSDSSQIAEIEDAEDKVKCVLCGDVIEAPLCRSCEMELTMPTNEY